jgi:hypothetical protein
MKNLVNKARSSIPESGSPHQEGIVSTPDRKRVYVAFIDAYSGGRVPVITPVNGILKAGREYGAEITGARHIRFPQADQDQERSELTS